MKGSRKRNACLGLLLGLVLPALAAAQVVPRTTSVREREFRHPDLYVPETTETLPQLPAPLAEKLRGTLTRLGVAQESIFFDSRTSRPNSLILHVPVIPGSGAGNRLSWPSRPPTNDADLGNEAWKGVHAYLDAHQGDLKIDLREVEESPRIGVFEGGSIIFIHARRVVGGIPVRDNSIGAAVNHGNLILLGLQKWGDVNEARTPGVSARAARDAVAAYLRPLAVSRSLREPTLEFIPMAGPGSIEYRLAWVVMSKVEEDMGTWEALVDAGNGTVFAFQDTNQYGSPSDVVSGGVYPISNDQRPPDGVEQPGWPMSFVDLTHNGVQQYADVGGNVGCIPGSISTALDGLFLRIVDDCGAINESGTGGIDLGSGPTASATDCATPAGHSRGDTKSARSGYYELNRQIEKAQSHLGPGTPAGIWLRQQVTAEMNENAACNAFWDGTQVNFFKSAFGQGCANTGEIAAIFDHEWGHGVDNNGVDPTIANPGEAIADMYAMLRLHVSCIGRGFFTDETCGGYGDECIGTPQDGCTGVRDIEYENHRCDEPHTISWIKNGFTNAQCGGTGAAPSCPGGAGPCSREVHCEGMVMGRGGLGPHDARPDGGALQLRHAARPRSRGAAAVSRRPAGQRVVHVLGRRRLLGDRRLPEPARGRRRQRQPGRRHAAHDGDSGRVRAARDPLRLARACRQRLRRRAHGRPGGDPRSARPFDQRFLDRRRRRLQLPALPRRRDRRMQLRPADHRQHGRAVLPGLGPRQRANLLVQRRPRRRLVGHLHGSHERLRPGRPRGRRQPRVHGR